MTDTGVTPRKDLVGSVVGFIAYQACWWACVLFAGTPWAFAGVVGTGVWVAFHLRQSQRGGNAGREVWLVVAATALGIAVDSGLVAISAIRFPEAVALGPLPTPLWMVALWAGFATTLSGPLARVMASFPLAVAVGALAGPVAYAGGERLGPIVVEGPFGLLAVAAAWALAMGLLSLLGRQRRD